MTKIEAKLEEVKQDLEKWAADHKVLQLGETIEVSVKISRIVVEVQNFKVPSDVPDSWLQMGLLDFFSLERLTRACDGNFRSPAQIHQIIKYLEHGGHRKYPEQGIKTLGDFLARGKAGMIVLPGAGKKTVTVLESILKGVGIESWK